METFKQQLDIFLTLPFLMAFGLFVWLLILAFRKTKPKENTSQSLVNNQQNLVDNDESMNEKILVDNNEFDPDSFVYVSEDNVFTKGCIEEKVVFNVTEILNTFSKKYQLNILLEKIYEITLSTIYLMNEKSFLDKKIDVLTINYENVFSLDLFSVYHIINKKLYVIKQVIYSLNFPKFLVYSEGNFSICSARQIFELTTNKEYFNNHDLMYNTKPYSEMSLFITDTGFIFKNTTISDQDYYELINNLSLVFSTLFVTLPLDEEGCDYAVEDRGDRLLNITENMTNSVIFSLKTTMDRLLQTAVSSNSSFRHINSLLSIVSDEFINLYGEELVNKMKERLKEFKSY